MDDHQVDVLADNRLERWRNLTLEQLEALVLAKRQERTESQVRRILAAQRALEAQDDYVPDEPGVPLNPPEGWRGPGGADLYLRVGGVQPLTEGAMVVTPQARRREARRNSILLFAELTLLLGFVVVIGLTFERMQALNQEVRQLREALPPPAVVLPTPTPVRYLPGGRLALETAAGGLDYALAAPPTPAPGAAQRLVIPAIGVDAPVVSGDDWESLKKGIGHRLGTANPGESDNMVVSAHNDIYGEIFRDLDQMQPGDEVLVYTEAGALRYIVNSVDLVAPTAVEVMDPTDYAALTMITCYPYLVDTQRVVVRAELAP